MVTDFSRETLMLKVVQEMRIIESKKVQRCVHIAKRTSNMSQKQNYIYFL